jgi:hypothetical protein
VQEIGTCGNRNKVFLTHKFKELIGFNKTNIMYEIRFLSLLGFPSAPSKCVKVLIYKNMICEIPLVSFATSKCVKVLFYKCMVYET